jgi:hypothetical protein
MRPKLDLSPRLAVSRIMQFRESDTNTTHQKLGNISKAASIDDADYKRATLSMKTTYQAVLDLRPHPSLFPWTHPSNLQISLLETAIDNMKENASKLQPPTSPDETLDLKQACTTFRCALRAWKTAARRRHKRSKH